MNRREFLKASIVSLAAAAAPKWAVALADVVEAEVRAPITPSVPVAPVPVPEQVDLATLLMENSIMRPRATVVKMHKRNLQIPAMNGNWPSGHLRSLTMTAHKMVAYTRTDGSITEAVFRPQAAQAAAWTEDYACLFGDGIGRPLGIVRSPAAITVPRRWSHAVTLRDLANMADAFVGSCNGAWFVSHDAAPDVWDILSKLYTIDGSGTVLGFPIIVTTMQPRRGKRGDMILADWRYYLIGDRGYTVERSDYDTFWDDNTISWRLVDRMDGRPLLTSPIEHNGKQVSPFVVLDGVNWRGSRVMTDDEAVWGMLDSDRLRRCHKTVMAEEAA